MTAPSSLQDLLDRAAVADLLNGYSYGIDLVQPALYRSVFTDQLHVDLAWSGVDEVMPADRWVEMVYNNLSVFDATQHRMTNIDVTLNGDTAKLRTQMTARHMLRIDGVEHHHIIGGHYNHDCVREARGWRIARLGLVITWEQGDRGLFEMATARGVRRQSID